MSIFKFQALHFHLRTAKEEFLLLKKQSNGTSQGSEQSSAQEVKIEDEKSPATFSEVEGLISTPTPSSTVRQPWEYVEEIMSLLKTAFPLLALTMETMVDQILQRLKPTTDEDIYRLIVALLNDGVQMYMQQLSRDPENSGQLSSATEMNLLRFAESMSPNHVKVQKFSL